MVSFSPWQVFRTVMSFAEVDKNPPIRRNTEKQHFQNSDQKSIQNPKKNPFFLKIPSDSCLKTRLTDEPPCIFAYICYRESSKTPQHSKWNCVGANRPQHMLHVVHQKFESFKKKSRRKSNSNLLINSKTPPPEIVRIGFRPNSARSSGKNCYTSEPRCFFCRVHGGSPKNRIFTASDASPLDMLRNPGASVRDSFFKPTIL